MLDRGPHFDAVHPANHLIHGAETQFRHPLANLFRDIEEEVDDVFRGALAFLAELGSLRSDADRASSEMALAHHDAAHGNQGHGGKSELLGSEQRCYGYVAPRLKLAVGLHADTAAPGGYYEHPP